MARRLRGQPKGDLKWIQCERCERRISAAGTIVTKVLRRMSIVRIANGDTLLLSMAFYDLSALTGWVPESVKRTHRRHLGAVAVLQKLAWLVRDDGH